MDSYSFLVAGIGFSIETIMSSPNKECYFFSNLDVFSFFPSFRVRMSFPIALQILLRSQVSALRDAIGWLCVDALYKADEVLLCLFSSKELFCFILFAYLFFNWCIVFCKGIFGAYFSLSGICIFLYILFDVII